MDSLVDTAQTTIGIARSSEGHATLMSYLCKNAERYFAEFSHQNVGIKLLEEQRRTQSQIYRFELKANSMVRVLRVKVPLSYNGQRTRNGNAHFRPRRFPATDVEIKFQFESSALAAIHNHFDALRDPRFGTVRILDSLPGVNASVMEEIGDPSLRQVFAKETRLLLPFRSAKSHAAFTNAGAWLREYHSMPKEAVTRHARRDEFIESVMKLTDYLAEQLGDSLFFRSVARETVAVALDVLPESLPTGLAHGDFAMRNILVGAGGRVTVVDTLGRWRTAIFEDIAYFLSHLTMTWPQIVSQGRIYDLNLMAQYENAFLAGYFRDSQIPLRTIRLYQIEALVDTWAGRVARGVRHRSGIAPVNGLKHAMQNRYFKKNLAGLLKSINSAELT